MRFKTFIILAVIAALVGGLAGTLVRGGRAAKEFLGQVERQRLQPVAVAGASEASFSATYELLEGWNLVAFPVKPRDFDTAFELMHQLASYGGYVTTVSVWDGDRWQEVSLRGPEEYGEDFTIVPGKAYFLRSHLQTSWKVIGTPVTEAELAEYRLQPGWNGVGLVAKGLSASQVIDAINQGVEITTEMDRWLSGRWDPFVKRLFSETDIQEYGNDFAIERERGYMIKVEEETIWKPK